MTAEFARRGFSVRIFLPGGDPAGLKVIEKSNWTGTGLVIPRALYAEARRRSELGRAGVYLLIGESERGPLPKVYIGEGDPIGPRLDAHGRAKDFWTHAVVFTSKDANLNKAHVQRLEARLVEMATLAKRCVLDNGNIPQAPSLSEADTAEVEGFLDDVRLCLPTLGYPFLERAEAGSRHGTASLTIKARGAEGQGSETPEGFVVRAGAKAAKSSTDSMHAYLKDIRTELLQQGVLRDAGEFYELVQDYTFPSPSTAASVIVGRNMNGREAWKASDGRTLKSIQEAVGGA